MRTFFFISITILGIGLLISSCKKTEDPYQSGDLGHDYFPLQIGKFIEYEVDSLLYSELTDSLITVNQIFVREEITDTLSDNLGNILYKVERFEKDNPADEWEIQKVLTVSIIDNQAFRTEDNIKYMPLVFPIRENKTWDGNLFTDDLETVFAGSEPIAMFKGWRPHQMRDTDQPLSFLGFDYDSTLIVSASNSGDNINELRQWTEIYAKGVGLIHRELWILDSQKEVCCPEQPSCNGIPCIPWEERGEKGFILFQTVTNFN